MNTLTKPFQYPGVMDRHGNSFVLVSATWLCLIYLTQGAPQAEIKKETPKPKGYKMDDLPPLSEAEIDENVDELKEVIRSYGPRALLVLNHTRYFQKGFEENFSECVNSGEIEAEKKRRWADLFDFFDQEGGMRFFKTFWWPKYEKKPTVIRKTPTTPEHAVLWDVNAANKHYGVKDDDDK